MDRLLKEGSRLPYPVLVCVQTSFEIWTHREVEGVAERGGLSPALVPRTSVRFITRTFLFGLLRRRGLPLRRRAGCARPPSGGCGPQLFRRLFNRQLFEHDWRRFFGDRRLLFNKDSDFHNLWHRSQLILDIENRNGDRAGKLGCPRRFAECPAGCVPDGTIPHGPRL